MEDRVPVSQYSKFQTYVYMCIKCRYDASKVNILATMAKTPYQTESLNWRISKNNYSELQPRILHAFVLTKVILGIFWAILGTVTWEPLVELTRNDPPAIGPQL